MKRAFATLGVVGLAAFAVAAPATAADGITVCHGNNGGYTAITIPGAGLNGHDRHSEDIIPPNEYLPAGQNWSWGSAIHGNGCVVAAPPVTETPVEEKPVVVTPVEEKPVVETPAVETPAATPAVDHSAVVPPAAVPPGAAPQAAAPVAPAPSAAVQRPAAATAATGLGTNPGYNAQTAVGGSDSAPSWLAGLGALAAAGAAVAVRRRSRPFTPAG